MIAVAFSDDNQKGYSFFIDERIKYGNLVK